MATSNKKWQISLFSALIFTVVIHPITYNITNNLFKNLVGPLSINDCPTNTGLIIHIIIFLLIVRFSMDLDIV